MVWINRLKLNKPLVKTIQSAGFTEPTEFQYKTLSRIAGGQNLIGIAPAGAGKTTTAVLAVLNRFRQGLEGSPRVLMVSPTAEAVIELAETFALLNKNKSVRVVALYKGIPMDEQLDALAEGADIVIATPDQARTIYLKLALNLNKINLFIVDDAEKMVAQRLQLPVNELARSIQKAQYLVFCEDFTPSTEKMIDNFMEMPALVEVKATPYRVLVVCLGNICRSPLGHALLEHHAKDQGLHWEVESAGTGNWHIGQAPDPRSIAVAQEQGIDISHQRGRQIQVEDFDYYDEILVMDRQNLIDVQALARDEEDKKKVRLFLPEDIVPDPYWDDTQFLPVFQMVESGALAYIEEWKRKQ